MDVLSTILSVAAIVISVLGVVWTSNQAKRAKEALDQQERFYQAQTVLHFTKTFLEIEKPIRGVFKSLERDKYWSLQCNEFYFYHHGAIPKLMYALWMVDLADFYRSDPDVWESHKKFMAFSKILYPEMIKFFSEINSLANENEIQEERHQKVKEYILKKGRGNTGTDLG